MQRPPAAVKRLTEVAQELRDRVGAGREEYCEIVTSLGCKRL